MDVERIGLPDGRMVPAKKFGGDMSVEHHELHLTEDEKVIVDNARNIWHGILNVDVNEDTNFFDCGAGSMDVVRWVHKHDTQGIMFMSG